MHPTTTRHLNRSRAAPSRGTSKSPLRLAVSVVVAVSVALLFALAEVVALAVAAIISPLFP